MLTNDASSSLVLLVNQIRSRVETWKDAAEWLSVYFLDEMNSVESGVKQLVKHTTLIGNQPFSATLHKGGVY